jgi:hypothetical protein
MIADEPAHLGSSNEFTGGSGTLAASVAVFSLVSETTMIDKVISCDANMPRALSNRKFAVIWLDITGRSICPGFTSLNAPVSK